MVATVRQPSDLRPGARRYELVNDAESIPAAVDEDGEVVIRAGLGLVTCRPKIIGAPPDDRTRTRALEWPRWTVCLSVPRRKAPPNMSRTFQFIDHRDGVILNRNLALAGRIYQELVVSEAELSRAVFGRQFCRRAQIRPFEFRLALRR